MVAYLNLKKLFKKIDREIKEITFASIKGKILYLLLFYFIAFDLCTIISVRVSARLGLFLLFVISMVSAFFLFSNRAAIGIKKDSIMIIHLKRFKMEDKIIFNIPIDNIKSITVSKIGFAVSLKISFISEEGILEKKKYGFTTFIMGSAERQDYAKKIYDELVKIQKVVDKGDF
ncbi:MAG: hypothetical protein E7171_08070 [Firmicutes bacterium]|nr:hypothetical protein [Bacillota bacterium]